MYTCVICCKEVSLSQGLVVRFEEEDGTPGSPVIVHGKCAWESRTLRVVETRYLDSTLDSNNDTPPHENDIVLFSNPWATVIDRKGWVVVRDTLGVGVAIIPFRTQNSGTEYLSRVEPCPSHGNEMHSACISGGIEPGETPAEAAARELEEEAGYHVQAHDLIPLGIVYPAKLLELQIHLFAMNVTGLIASTPKGDGSTYEAAAHNTWCTLEQAYQVPDAVWGTTMFRLQRLVEKV